MRAWLVAMVLWQTAAHVAPEPRHFRLARAVTVDAKSGARACAVLDGATYASAKPGLADVRLFAGTTEVPYALTMSETAAGAENAQVLNLGERGGHLQFDLEMPRRPYSSVDLKLAGQNWIASAKVYGKAGVGDTCCTNAQLFLGTFTLFDLTGQRLGRNTSLPLAESTFPFLHVELAARAAPGFPGFAAAPGMVEGASVPPSREAQTVYTTVAATSELKQQGQASIATFSVPAHVPVERVSFAIEPDDQTNFSREVRITAKAAGSGEDRARALDETVDGTISRLRLTEGGEEIRQESLAVPATLGSNGASAATISVAIENGDDKPLAIRAVRLEMRERKLCFDAPAGPLTMYYGDDRLAAPVYDYSRLFQTNDKVVAAQLGAAQANQGFVARAESRTLLERQPEILWVALLAVVGVLGAVAVRSAKRV